MKKMIIFATLMCVAVAIFGQNTDSRSDDMYFSTVQEKAALENARQKRLEIAEANKNPVYASGTALKESVGWQCAAIGSGIVGGLALSAGTASAITSGKSSNAMQFVGYGLICFSAAAEIVSIVKTYKAGRSLQVAAGKITYTF